MKVFTCTSFQGHYPVGVSAVVVAKDIAKALALLNVELVKAGLKQHSPLTLKDLDEVNTRSEYCEILQDGDY